MRANSPLIGGELGAGRVCGGELGAENSAELRRLRADTETRGDGKGDSAVGSSAARTSGGPTFGPNTHTVHTEANAPFVGRLFQTLTPPERTAMLNLYLVLILSASVFSESVSRCVCFYSKV